MVFLLPLLTFLISAGACMVYLHLARRWQILDRPNHRSSHALPTPHGGGVPIIIAMALVFAGAIFGGITWPWVYGVIVSLALLLTLTGVLDDLIGLPVRLRFVVYALACVLLLPAIFGTPGGWSGVDWLAAPVILLGLLWLLNLFNFMDGIDGLAATQCILAASTAAVLTGLHGGDPYYALFCLMLAAAHAGFLLWNWSPAKLFMGDAGSVPAGFLLGALALVGAQAGYLPLACWLILLAAFITDATATLLWRAAHGHDLTSAHRLHAYQRLSRKFRAHAPVVFLLISIHVFWLLPLAFLASVHSSYSLYLVILAYFPLVLGVAKALRLG